MKTNFTLTAQTADLLVQRIAKAISIKGHVTLDHYYTGAKEMRGFLLSIIPDASWFILPTIKSNSSKISIGDYVIEHDKEMKLVRINWGKDRYEGFEYGSGMCIEYGQKMQVHSGKICYKEPHITGDLSMKTVFTLK